ncbi:hypothetical protein CAOG_009614 [Capsaspora owczarzaki ATCC 30864]|uniref:Uncharacterized protein n=1 Tax=Capsaspora owczarzaki (strain ATCC 30864) TaxID=595528 RepID=A0A0D2X248_CAPO3|nr:hypothetical protein CAOG_009614 [Capsaspora owczarzaki ATCC 30864]
MGEPSSVSSPCSSSSSSSSSLLQLWLLRRDSLPMLSRILVAFFLRPVGRPLTENGSLISTPLYDQAKNSVRWCPLRTLEVQVQRKPRLSTAGTKLPCLRRVPRKDFWLEGLPMKANSPVHEPSIALVQLRHRVTTKSYSSCIASVFGTDVLVRATKRTVHRTVPG